MTWRRFFAFCFVTSILAALASIATPLFLNETYGPEQVWQIAMALFWALFSWLRMRSYGRVDND